MSETQEDPFADIRTSVRALCAQFPGDYWQKCDEARDYPTAFVEALTKAGFLAVLIPEAYNGSGLGVSAAGAILEEIHKSGCSGGACHAQMYTMGTVLRHGSEAQKAEVLPKIAAGDLRLQAFGVTEPTSGTDTSQIRTTAVREGNEYVINGQKVWTSRAEHSDLLLLLARTTPRDQVEKRYDGLSVFLIDMQEAKQQGLTIQPLRAMINHATTELFFDNLRIPASSLIGEEGKGFRYILDGMNAERILIAHEAIGDSRWFVEKAVNYANERVVFDRPIMAKQLAGEAAWKAADMCFQTHGGFGFAAEYDVERKFREARLYRTAPVSTNMVLSYIAEHVLGLPRSY
ncbi:MAG: acyl-CoA dehydrogenase family protein [Rhodospirillales bacterium]